MSDPREFQYLVKNYIPDFVYVVLKRLQQREIHPNGRWESGKFYSTNIQFSVRSPSRRYPYSEMTHCRTQKHVEAVYKKFKPQTQADLETLV